MTSDGAAEPHAVVVIGAGFAGITAAIRLHEAGIEDVVVLERGENVGGTWRDARYPGAAVDVPSVLYSLSFAPNAEWTQVNAGQAEILEYITAVVAGSAVQERIRLRSEVVACDYDARLRCWETRTADGTCWRSRFLVHATGLLSNPNTDSVPGIEGFGGPVFHAARWDRAGFEEVARSPRTIGVIGTGASAAQLVPELLAAGHRLVVFQRTPSWVLPRFDAPIPENVRRAFAAHPWAQRAARALCFRTWELVSYALIEPTALTRLLELIASVHLRRTVQDPALRRKLTPRYRIGCKRPLSSNDFLRALADAACTVVDEPIVGFGPAWAITRDGQAHELDCLVLATGYRALDRLAEFPVTGRDRRRLGDAARTDGVYRSVEVPGFPNLFVMMGPGSFGHSSELLFIEAQAEYIVRAVRECAGAVAEVTHRATRRHVDAMTAGLRRTTFLSGCASWFRRDSTEETLVFPGSARSYRSMLSRYHPSDHHRLPPGPR